MGTIPSPIPLLITRSNDSSSSYGMWEAAEPQALQRGCPWLSNFPFLFLPGVADPRERAHPVPDRARGGARGPFQESRDRGLASDGAECAAQRRYGAQNGEQPPLPAFLPHQLLLFLLPSSLSL